MAEITPIECAPMKRALRFLWLVLRGVLIVLACFAGLIAASLFLIWAMGEWAPVYLLGFALLAALVGIGCWVRSCWAEAKGGAR